MWVISTSLQLLLKSYDMVSLRRNTPVNPTEQHLPCSLRFSTIAQIIKSQIFVMAEIPTVCLDQQHVSSRVCVFVIEDALTMHLYMFAHNPVHPCVPGGRRPSAECQWNMVLIWLLAHTMASLPAYSPDAFHGPFGQTKPRGGVKLSWGVRGEVYTGRVWDRVHNQPGTLLSNYHTMRGGWGCGVRACAWPSASVKRRVALSTEKAACLKGALLHLTFEARIASVLSDMLRQGEWECRGRLVICGKTEFH